MKATQQQLIDLCVAAGVASVEIVADEAQSDFALDTALTSIDEHRISLARPRIEEEVTTRVKGDIAGQSGGILRRNLAKATGIAADELKDLKDGEAIAKAIEHYGKSINASKEDVQKMILELTEAKDKERDDAVKLVEQERDTWAGKYAQRDLIDSIQAGFKDVPFADDVDKTIAAQDFLKHISEKFHVTVNEAKKAIEFFQKDKPAMPALKDNQPIKLLDEAKEYFTPRGQWKKDTRHLAEQALQKINQQSKDPYVNAAGSQQKGTADEWQTALNQAAVAQGIPVPGQ